MRQLLTIMAPGFFVLLWSTGFIGSKLGAPYAEPMVFLSIRFLPVLPFLALIAYFSRSKWPKSPSLIAHCIATGILVHGIYLGGVFWAIDQGMPAGASAIIVGLQPVLTTLAASLVLGERVLIKHYTGLVIGGLGLSLVLAPRLGLAGSGIDTATITAVLMAVAAISVGTVYQKRFVQKTNLLTATFWQYIGALLITLPLAMFEDWTVVWSGEFVFALFWLTFVLSIGAIMLLMLLIRQGAVSEVASLFYLVPVATAIEGYFLFGEILNVQQIIGMLLVVCAVLLIRFRVKKATSS